MRAYAAGLPAPEFETTAWVTPVPLAEARVARRHLAFAGNQEDTVGRIRLDSGPAAAALLAADDVDVVLLTPV